MQATQSEESDAREEEPPPRLPAIAGGEAHARPAGADRFDPHRTARPVDHRCAGPFAVFLHAPEFGELAQQLGGYCRLKTRVPPRLSEFAILVTAQAVARAIRMVRRMCRMPSAPGVKPQTIRACAPGACRSRCQRTSARSTTSSRSSTSASASATQTYKPRAGAARRRRHGRAGRHPRLLRDDRHDRSTCSGCRAAGGRAAAVPGGK